MDRRLMWILLLILWLILCCWVCWKFLCGASATAAAAAPVENCDDKLAILDGRKFDASTCDNFRFIKSKFNGLQSSAELNSSLRKTADYLKANDTRGLTVTGLYSADESYGGILSNIGLARANTIKNKLTSLGVPAKQISTAAALSGIGFFTGDTLTRGARFAFGDIDMGEDRIAAIKDRLFGKPVTLYFGTNQDNIALNAQQRTDFGDLIYYLDNVSGSSLNVSGHTDNVGDHTSNVQLSQDRADFVMNYLTRNGIGASSMSSQGFGPDRPVADNNTDDGRALNRRVEVTLQ